MILSYWRRVFPLVVAVGLLFWGAVAIAQGPCAAPQFSGATAFPAGSRPGSVAVEEFNGDSRPDLAVANANSNNVSIFLGTGTGSFVAASTFAVGSGPESVAVGDFNGDGRRDLAVANFISNNVSILLGTGTGSFGAAVGVGAGTGPRSVAVVDLNGDGRQDLAVANRGSNDVSILLGTGTGSFGAASSFAVGSAAVSVAVGDFNGDGQQDLATANSDSDNVSILVGTGTGSFGAASSFAAGTFPFSVSVGDFNGDSRQDLAVANQLSANVSILLGTGTGSFAAANNFAAGSLPRTVIVGNFNGGDSRPDLAIANFDVSTVSIVLGSGGGSFGAPTSFNVGFNPGAVAVGDFNGDGRQDLAVANRNNGDVNGDVTILLNTSNCLTDQTGVTLQSNLNPANAGQTVALTATVNGTAPTGTVTFKDGGFDIAGCVAVALSGSGNSPTAACMTSVLTAGSHSITAVYSGDGNNAASTSSVLTQVINAMTALAQRIFLDGFEDFVQKRGLGTNLEGFEDFAAAYPLTDFFKQSRPWFTTAPGASFDTGQAAQLNLDADGWVRSLPACTPGSTFCQARTVWNSAGSNYPNGNYLVLYDGQGTLTYSGAASLVSAGTGRDVIAINQDDIVILTLESTSPAPNHLRNIRVLAPGFDPAVATVPTFHPDFVARLSPYRAIRFMDWMRANGGGFGGAPNPQITFAQRPLPSHAHWTREGGVPLEPMLELANVTDAEPWFTLPHQVNDDYVRGFARIVKSSLEAGRRVYVEHSNEVWNSFPQGFDVEAAGLVSFPGGSDSAFTKRLNQHGLRTAQICALFRAVYAEAPARPAGQIICSIGAQAANAFTATEAADCPVAVARNLRTQPCLGAGDAIAIAPYFGNYLDVSSNENEIVSWNLNELFTEINDGGQIDDAFASSNTPCTDNFPQVMTVPCPTGALEEVIPWMVANKQAATQRGMAMIAYEGGQHLVGVQGVENNQTITTLFGNANRDARMGTAYIRYLDSWKANGGELFVHFNLSGGYGRFGNWGTLESIAPPLTPLPTKAQAIVTFNAANPCWWTGCND